MNAFMTELRQDVTAGLGNLMTEVLWTPKASVTYQCKLGSSVPRGASTLNLYAITNFWWVAAGDSLRVNPYSDTYKITAAQNVVAGGTLSDVAISPALASPAAAGSLVMLTRNAGVWVQAIVTSIDVTKLIGTLVGVTDTKVLISAASVTKETNSDTVAPCVGDTVTLNGKARVIYSVQLDAAGAFFTCLAK